MSLNVSKILRRTEMSLDEALKSGHASLVAGQADGAVKTSKGYVRSDMLATGWSFEKTTNDSEVFFKNIPVLCIFHEEHASFGPPSIDDDLDSSDAIDALNAAMDEAENGMSPAALIRNYNNGSYLAAVAKARPKKAGSVEELEAAFLSKNATNAAEMAKYVASVIAKTKKDFLRAWFASQSA